MRIKKRKRTTRWRGTHTHGRGFKKKARGSGHRGGVGMAGTGKRGDQKKTLVLNMYGNDYFGKSKAWRKKIIPKLKSINLFQINDLARGKKEIELNGYKVLSDGELKEKIIIRASAASKSAMEKIKKHGSEIILTKKNKK